MRTLLRSPLTWMVAAEVIVVALLVAVAWQFVTAVRSQGAAPPAVAAAAPTVDEGTGVPDLDVPVVTAVGGPLPGLNITSAFWRARLADLNRDEALFAQLEWRVVSGAEAAVKRYVDSVVLPALRRAERGGRSR